MCFVEKSLSREVLIYVEAEDFSPLLYLTSTKDTPNDQMLLVFWPVSDEDCTLTYHVLNLHPVYETLRYQIFTCLEYIAVFCLFCNLLLL